MIDHEEIYRAEAERYGRSGSSQDSMWRQY